MPPANAIPDGSVLGPDGAPAPGSGSAMSHTLFLQTEGVTLAAGADDATTNTSSLVTGPVTLAKFLGSDAQRAADIAAIKEQLDGTLSPYDVTVTLSRPTAGPYDMLVMTDDLPTKAGQQNGTAVPDSCNTVASEVALQFGTETDLNHLARNAVSLLGITAGIPLSNKLGDCMCLADTDCATLSTPCTIGGAGTLVSTTPGCPNGQSTDDETALFLAAFGPH